MSTTSVNGSPAPQPASADEASSLRARFRRWMRPPRRLKFTQAGRYFTGMTLLVGFGAINTGNNLLYLLLGMTLSLIVVSGMLSEQVINRVTVRHKLPGRLFARHPAPIEVTVTNPRARTASYSLEVVERIEGIAEGARPGAYFLRVEGGGTATSAFRYAFPRRGRFVFEGFEIVTHFPFGLFRKSRDLDAASEVVVFPALAEPGGVSGLTELLQGEVHQPRPGRGGDFHALRDYRVGDDVRDIDWKATARRDQPITREREKEEARKVTLCLANVWPSRLEASLTAELGAAAARARVADELEYAVELCAGLAERLLAEGFVVGLSTLGERVGLGSGSGQLERLLRHLALVEFGGDPRAAEPSVLSRRFAVTGDESCIMVGVAGGMDGLSGGRVLATVPTRRPDAAEGA